MQTHYDADERVPLAPSPAALVAIAARAAALIAPPIVATFTPCMAWDGHHRTKAGEVTLVLRGTARGLATVVDATVWVSIIQAAEGAYAVAESVSLSFDAIGLDVCAWEPSPGASLWTVERDPHTRQLHAAPLEKTDLPYTLAEGTAQ